MPGPEGKNGASMMHARKTTILPETTTGISMNLGCRIAGGAAHYRQEQAKIMSAGRWWNRNPEVPSRFLDPWS